MNALGYCGVAAAVLLCAKTLVAESAINSDDYGPCGQVSLYCAAHRAGFAITWEQVVAQMGSPDVRQQHSFADIAMAAKRLGLHPVAVEVGPPLWNTLPSPSIAHMRYPSRGRKEPHFVTVLDTSSPEGIWLIDPPFQAMQVRRDSFEQAATNRFLVLAKSEDEARQITDFYSGGHEKRTLFILLLLNVIVAAGIVCYCNRVVLWLMLLHGGTLVRYIPRSCAIKLQWPVVCSAIGLFGAIVGAMIFGPHGIGVSPPELIVSQKSIDLGVVIPGKQSIDVLLKNGGGRALQFKTATTSCNCTQADLPESLPPGSEGLLKLIVTTLPGQGRSEVVLNSNDPKGAQEVQLTWIGMAKPILSPSRVICQATPLAKDYEQIVTLFCTKGKTEDISPEIVLFRSSSEIDVSLIDTLSSDSANDTGEKIAEPELMMGINASNFIKKQLLVHVTAPEGPKQISPRCWLEIRYKTFTEKIDIPVAVRFVRDVVPRFDEIVFSDVSFSTLKGMKRVVPLDVSEHPGNVTIAQSPSWLKSSLVRSPSNEFAVEIEVSEEITEACDGKIVLQTSQGEVPIGVRLFALK